jgi:hypothetical protein
MQDMRDGDIQRGMHARISRKTTGRQRDSYAS